MPEEALATMAMLAQLRNMKVNATVNKATGKVTRGGSTSMFDMYEVVKEEDGTPKLKWRVDEATNQPFVRGVDANINTRETTARAIVKIQANVDKSKKKLSTLQNNLATAEKNAVKDPKWDKKAKALAEDIRILNNSISLDEREINDRKNDPGPSNTGRDITSLDPREVQVMKRVYERMHGSYRQEERTRMEYTVLGEMFMQYKKYLPNILKNALGSKALHQNLGRFEFLPPEKQGDKKEVMRWQGRIIQGRWTLLSKVFANYFSIRAEYDNPTNFSQRMANRFLPTKHEDYAFDKLSEGQRMELLDFYVTGGMMLLFSGANLFMFSGTGDDDSWKKILARIINDFSQQYNPVELSKNLTNLTPASLRKLHKVIGSTWDMVVAAGEYGVTGDDSRLFTNEGRLRGSYELKRAIPFLSSYHDIVRFLENQDNFEADFQFLSSTR